MLKLYHEAVKQQQEGHLNEAKSLYCDILCSQVVKAVSALHVCQPLLCMTAG